MAEKFPGSTPSLEIGIKDRARIQREVENEISLLRTLRDRARLGQPSGEEMPEAQKQKFLNLTDTDIEEYRTLMTSKKTEELSGVKPVESEERGMKEIQKEGLVGVTATVPAGEHWVIEGMVGSTITVPEGAKLSATGVVKSTILAKNPGDVHLEGAIKTEIKQIPNG